MIISRWILHGIWSVSDKCRENQNTHSFSGNFSSKILTFMRKCGKISHSRRGHRWQHSACAMRAGYLRLQTQIENKYCFPTTTMATRRRLNVTLYVYWLSFFRNKWIFEENDAVRAYRYLKLNGLKSLTLIVLMWRIGWAHNNARK